MISKLKIIPLGGLGEIGKNMTVFEFGGDIIVVDCGMGFPDEDMYGLTWFCLTSAISRPMPPASAES